jgi:hypothetical protein
MPVCFADRVQTDIPVRLLLQHPQINDTIRDEQGRTPLECAADVEVSSTIEGMSRALRELMLRLSHGSSASVQRIACELCRQLSELLGREQRDGYILTRTKVSVQSFSLGYG